MPQYGKSALEIVMTKLHAGGKFGGEGYKVSGGLHGVGVSVVNALSERLDRRSVPRRLPLRANPTDAECPTATSSGTRSATTTGTTIHFLPDPEIFDDLDFNFNVLSQRLREVAFLNRGLAISLRDERDQTVHEARVVDAAGEPLVEGEEAVAGGVGGAGAAAEAATPGAEAGVEAGAVVAPGMQLALGQAGDAGKADGVRSVTFRYDGGIIDFVRHINAQKDPIHERHRYFSADDEKATTRWSWRCSGTPATSTTSSPSPTTSTPTRAARTSRASGRR